MPVYDYSYELKKRVIKDYSLPIQAVSNEHIDYAFKLLSRFNKKYEVSILNSTDLAQSFCKSEMCDVQEFSKAIRSFTQHCMDSVSSLDSYKQFNEVDMPQNKNNPEFPMYSKGLDIYIHPNDGKRFISIDLSKANFQSLKYVNAFSSYTKPIREYRDFLKEFGNSDNVYLIDYIRLSKSLRQPIFGNLNPKRQQGIEKIMTEQIIQSLLGNFLTKDDFYGYTKDEIILNDTCNTRRLADNRFEDVYVLTNTLGFEIHIEDFYLQEIKPYSYWMKTDVASGNILSVKKVPVVYFLQVIKHLIKEPIVEEDMKFLYEGTPCKMLSTLW